MKQPTSVHPKKNQSHKKQPTSVHPQKKKKKTISHENN